jgi:hypothetical protein
MSNRELQSVIRNYPSIRASFKSEGVVFCLDLLTGIIENEFARLIDDIIETPDEQREEMKIIWDQEFSIYCRSE